MTEAPKLEELNYLYSSLSAEQRDELLQSLLIAASRGGQAVTEVLQTVLLVKAGEELVNRTEEGSK